LSDTAEALATRALLLEYITGCQSIAQSLLAQNDDPK